jgi:pyruvate/2-oxoglutarate dehydrogenase complex dihydrolipoamide acyltransferase (E2) component
MNGLRRRLAIATWRAPREPNLYGRLEVDATAAVAALERLRAEFGEPVTIEHLVGAACARALPAAPGLSARVVFGRWWPRKTPSLSFVVFLEDGDNLAVVKVEDPQDVGVVELTRRARAGAERLRRGEDKQFNADMALIRATPMPVLLPGLRLWAWLGRLGVRVGWLGLEPAPLGDVCISNVGVFGLDEGYSPPTPFGANAIDLVMGTVRDEVVAVDGEPTIRPTLTLCLTANRRAASRRDIATLAEALRAHLEQPDSLPA